MINYKSFFPLLLLVFNSFLTAQNKSDYNSIFQNLREDNYNKTLFSKSSLNINELKRNNQITNLKIDSLNGDSILILIENKIPLSYSSQVEKYIHLYEKGLNGTFLNYLINYYAPEVKSQLISLRLPEELFLLPAVCSGYSPNSINTNGGTGFWQLNYPQALKYGLMVNEWIDERKDIKKSTLAALSYLSDLHEKYNNWELALAAYSCGSSSINNLLKRNHAKSYSEIYPYLPEATRDIVPAFTAMIFTYSQDNSNGNKIEPKLETDTFYLEHSLQFKAIEDLTDIKSKELAFYNPVLNKEIFPTHYQAVFPKSKMDKFYQLCDSIYYYQDSVLLKPIEVEITITNNISKNGEPIVYKVKSGDVLGVIAERHGVRVSQIQDWNNLNGTRINVGQELLIYSGETSSNNSSTNNSSEEEDEKPIPSAKNESNDKYITYTVKSGDNLWLIAKNFPGISAQNIMDLNGIDENLSVGQVLKIKLK